MPTRQRPLSALRSLGVQPGDRVVTWLPNALEAVIVMLGATSIGAVYSSTSPDFGTRGVLDRFGQIEPVVLFAADSYLYGGKRFDCLERLDEIRAGLPTLRATVVVGDAPAGTVGWDAFLAPHRAAPFAPERFAFDHPWYVLYSSGTTGVPKCIVHRAGGVLLQHLKEQQLHCDIRRGDRVMYFTTTGWMMWNWLASTLASGATAVLYDGSPFHPGPNALFDVADAEQLTLLGVSAKFIDSVGKARHRAGDHPRVRRLAHDLLHRLAALTRRVPRGLRAGQVRRAPRVDRGRHRPVRLPGRRRSHRTGVRGRDPTTGARHGRRRRGRRRIVVARLAGRPR